MFENLDQVSIVLGGILALIGGSLTGLFSLLVQHKALKAERERREEDHRRDIAVFQDKLLQERLAPIYAYIDFNLKYIGYLKQQLRFRNDRSGKPGNELFDRLIQVTIDKFVEYWDEHSVVNERASVSIKSLGSEYLQSLYEEASKQDDVVTDSFGQADGTGRFQKEADNMIELLKKLSVELDEYRLSHYASY